MQLYTSALAERVEARRRDLLRAARSGSGSGSGARARRSGRPKDPSRRVGELLIAVGQRLAGPEPLTQRSRPAT